MNIRQFFSALTLATALFSFASCVKEAPVTDTPVAVDAPVIPDGNRIIIHFGTSTQRGCMYSFSNCIWIGWGTEVLNYEGRFALQFSDGDAAGQYFGNYFPLTADFEIDAQTAADLHIEQQVIPAGFYLLRDVASGQATGKRLVVFDPAQGHPIDDLVNPKNPQDNIGQLHNLNVQVLLNDNREALKSLEGNSDAIHKLLTDKTVQFLSEAELPANSADQKRAYDMDLTKDFGDYAARLNETRLSANDKKVLVDIFNQAAGVPVRTPKDLGVFVNLMTGYENQYADGAGLDNPKVVLSMLSVLKYSRYYWFWKSVSSADPGTGGATASSIPDWVWADVIGMELGGPIVSAVASAAVYLDQR